MLLLYPPPIPLLHCSLLAPGPNRQKDLYGRRWFPELTEIYPSMHPSFHPPSKFTYAAATAESKAASKALKLLVNTDEIIVTVTQSVKYCDRKSTGSWGSTAGEEDLLSRWKS